MTANEKKIKLAYMNPELVAEQIGKFIIDEVTNMNRTGGIIGLSGGVDSTVTAALTKKAFDKYNKSHPPNHRHKIELIGYILPSETNNQKDTEDGVKIAKTLGIRYESLSIQPVIESYKTTNPEVFESKVEKGNLASRIRANILSTKAASENKLVIGTGNKDEDFSIGYYTLFGDGAVHISPIGNLPKRLVREMARYLGFSYIADKIPTAGLEPGQTDFKDLGYSYDTVELVVEGLHQGLTIDDIILNNQVKSGIGKDIADYALMYDKSKFNDQASVVEDIARRHVIAKSKALILHPPAAEITLEYR